jgi:hypothetical protein
MNNGIRKNILAPSFRVFLNNKSKRTTHAYSCTLFNYVPCNFNATLILLLQVSPLDNEGYKKETDEKQRSTKFKEAYCMVYFICLYNDIFVLTISILK